MLRMRFSRPTMVGPPSGAMWLPTLQAWAFTYRLPPGDHGLEGAYRCRVELRDFQQPFMAAISPSVGSRKMASIRLLSRMKSMNPG